MDGVSFGLGVVSTVIQTYTAVVAAYDVYLEVTEFPSTYQDIRIGFLIERYRLELWANEIISERWVISSWFPPSHLAFHYTSVLILGPP